MKWLAMFGAVLLLPLVSAAPPSAFKAPVELTDSAAFYSPVWIDADGNGVEDLAGYDYNLKRVAYYPRSGEGKPSTGRRLLAGAPGDGASGAFAVDVDHDGRQDLVIQDGTRLVWWRGMAGAPMVFMDTWVAGLKTERWIDQIIDMDRDGNLDLLMAAQEYEEFDGEMRVSRLRVAEIGYGNENGAFEWLRMPEEAMDYYGRGAVDVDGDGDLDWAFASTRIAILQGRSVVRVQTVAADGQLVDVDGLPGAELLVTQGFAFYDSQRSPRIQVLKLQTGGDWAVIADFSTPDYWYMLAPQTAGVVVGNFDADPEPDLLIPVVGGRAVTLGMKPEGLMIDGALLWDSGLRKDDFVSVVKRRGAGLDSLLVQSAAMATDVFGSPVSVGPAHWKRSEISLSSGYPTITAPVEASAFHDPRGLAVVKMNGSPRLASLGGDDRTLSVWADLSGPGARRIIGRNTLPGIGLVAGNFLGNATEELVWMTSKVDFSAPLSLEWRTSYLQAGRPYISDGNGYGNSRYETFNGYLPMALLGAGDFDGDGTDDVLYARADGGMIWRSGLDPEPRPFGAKKFGAVEHQIGVVPLLLANQPKVAGPENYVVRDMDGDGDLDIVQFPSIYGEVAALYTNDGRGQFATRAVGPVVSRGISIVVGNFDGNETPDLLLAGSDFSGQPVMRISHDAGAGAVEEVPGQLRIEQKMVAGDFNGDGLDDLAIAGGIGSDLFGNPISTAGIYTLTRRNPLEFGHPVALTGEIGSVTAFIAADMNLDGKADLVHGSAVDGTILYLEAAPMTIWPSFADWAESHAVPATNEDSDGDGATNFQEYFSGSNPLLAENPGTAVGEPGGRALLKIGTISNYGNSISTLQARQARPAAIAEGVAEVSLEHSTDLEHWQPVDQLPSIRQVPGKADWEVVEWNFTFYPDATSRGFYRLRTEITGDQ